MQALAGISLLLLIVASVVVGVRLIRLWQRTRQQPELFLGLLLVLLTGVGYPLFILSRATDAIGFPAAWGSLLLGSVSADAGFLMLYLFTWKTFRPDSRGCAWLVALAACAFVVNVVTLAADTWSAGTTVVDLTVMPLWRQWCSILATDVCYAWTAVESFRYYAVLRKRRALGLVEPLVANRLLLWGQMSLVTLSVLVVNNVSSLQRIDVLATPWIMACTSLGGVVQAACLWLIFLPPQRYRAWVAAAAAS
jgi:hypothetical protein